MENDEKLKINIYPPQIEIQKSDSQKIYIKIADNLTNETKPESIYENLIAQNASEQPILDKYKNQIISALEKINFCINNKP